MKRSDHRGTDIVYLCNVHVCCSVTARDWWTCLWSSSFVVTAYRSRPPSGTEASADHCLVRRMRWSRCRWQPRNRYRRRRSSRRRRSPSSPRSCCCCCCSGCWPPYFVPRTPPPRSSEFWRSDCDTRTGAENLAKRNYRRVVGRVTCGEETRIKNNRENR